MSALAESSSRTRSTFAVIARAEPGALERIVAVLARGFPMPRRFSSVHHDRSGRLALNLEMADLEPDRAELLAARLRGLVGVEKVFVATSDDRGA
jgi:acetolactate synthase regulatory subunit